MYDLQSDMAFPIHNPNESTLQPKLKQTSSYLNCPTDPEKQHSWPFIDAGKLAPKYENDSQHET